jgi:hypothetical protein
VQQQVWVVARAIANDMVATVTVAAVDRLMCGDATGR